MHHPESVTAAVLHVLGCAVAAKEASLRGDPPERVAAYLADVARWATLAQTEFAELPASAEVRALAQRFRPVGRVPPPPPPAPPAEST